MKDYLDALKEKYNYSDELINVLATILPAFVNHFGDKHATTIYEAVFNSEIKVGSISEYEPYYREYFDNEENYPYNPGGVGVHQSYARVKDGQLIAKHGVYIFNIDNSTEVFKKESTMLALIHELGHLVKSYKREFIQDDVIVQRRGFVIDVCDFDGKDLSDENFESFVGMEEIFNSYDEIAIFEKAFGYVPEDSLGYGGVGYFVYDLMSIPEVKEKIVDHQFTGDESWKELIGKDIADKIIEDITMIFSGFSYSDDMDALSDDKIDEAFLESGLDFSQYEEFMMNYINEYLTKKDYPIQLAREDLEKISNQLLQRFNVNSNFKAK